MKKHMNFLWRHQKLSNRVKYEHSFGWLDGRKPADYILRFVKGTFTLCSTIIVCHNLFGDANTGSIDEMYLGTESAVIYDGYYLKRGTQVYSSDAEGMEQIWQELYGGVICETFMWWTWYWSQETANHQS